MNVFGLHWTNKLIIIIIIIIITIIITIIIIIIIMCRQQTDSASWASGGGLLPCNTRQQTMPVGSHKYMSVTEAAAESALLGDVQPQQRSNTSHVR